MTDHLFGKYIDFWLRDGCHNAGREVISQRCKSWGLEGEVHSAVLGAISLGLWRYYWQTNTEMAARLIGSGN